MNRPQVVGTGRHSVQTTCQQELRLSDRQRPRSEHERGCLTGTCLSHLMLGSQWSLVGMSPFPAFPQGQGYGLLSLVGWFQETLLLCSTEGRQAGQGRHWAVAPEQRHYFCSSVWQWPRCTGFPALVPLPGKSTFLPCFSLTLGL